LYKRIISVFIYLEDCEEPEEALFKLAFNIEKLKLVASPDSITSLRGLYSLRHIEEICLKNLNVGSRDLVMLFRGLEKLRT